MRYTPAASPPVFFSDCGHAVFACLASGWLHRKLCPRLSFFLTTHSQPFSVSRSSVKCVSVQKALRLFIVYRSLQIDLFFYHIPPSMSHQAFLTPSDKSNQNPKSVPCHSISHFIYKLPYRQKAFPILTIDFIPQIQFIFLLAVTSSVPSARKQPSVPSAVPHPLPRFSL